MSVEKHMALCFLLPVVWHQCCYPYPDFFTALLAQKHQCCSGSLRTLALSPSTGHRHNGTGLSNGSKLQILPAMNVVAFHNEIPADNNSPQVPRSRMLLNDLNKWPFEGSMTIYLLSAAFSSQKKVLVELQDSPPGFQRTQTTLKNTKVQTRKVS